MRTLFRFNRGNGHSEDTGFSPVRPGARSILAREPFRRMLYVERKRAERAGRSFVLMLLESTSLLRHDADPVACQKIVDALARSTRDTDITGWHRDGSAIGVIFTELGRQSDLKPVANLLADKVGNALASVLSKPQIDQIKLSFQVFPEDGDDQGPAEKIAASLYDERSH